MLELNPANPAVEARAPSTLGMSPTLASTPSPVSSMTRPLWGRARPSRTPPRSPAALMT